MCTRREMASNDRNLSVYQESTITRKDRKELDSSKVPNIFPYRTLSELNPASVASAASVASVPSLPIETVAPSP